MKALRISAALLFAALAAAPARAAVRFVADFDEGQAPLDIGSASSVSTFGTGAAFSFQPHLDAQPAVGNRGGSLKIAFTPGSAAGVLLNFGASENLVSPTSYTALSFWVRTDAASASRTFKLNLKRATSPAEPAFRPDVRQFLPSGALTTSWQKVVIPLRALMSDYVVATSTPLSDVNGIVLNFDAGFSAETVYIDDVLFHTKTAPVFVDNFADGDAASAFGFGAVDYQQPPAGFLTSAYTASDSSASAGSLSSVWSSTTTDAATLLRLDDTEGNGVGVDVSGCDTLALSLKADASGAGATIGLGLKRDNGTESVHASVVTLTTAWQPASRALADFGFASLADLSLVELWFQKGSGPSVNNHPDAFTVLTDDVRFLDTVAPTAPSALQRDGDAVANGESFGPTQTIAFTAPVSSGDAGLESVRFEHDGMTAGATWYAVYVNTNTSSAGHSFTWVTSSLAPGSTYRVRAAAMDVAGNLGATAFTSVVVRPCDVDQSADATAPALVHTAVSTAAAARPLFIAISVTDNARVAGATVFYRAKGQTAYSQTAFTLPSACGASVSATAAIPADAVTAAGLEYYVQATDSINTASFASAGSPQFVAVEEVSAQRTVDGAGGSVTLADSRSTDGETSVSIPAGALGSAQAVAIEERAADRAPSGVAVGRAQPFAAYDFTPEGLAFRRPVTLTLLYPDLDQDGFVEDPLTGSNTSVAESSLRVYFHDGFEWRGLGGTVDAARNTVTATTMHFSLYAVFPAAAATADAIRPRERIITPAGSPGVNDFLQFGGAAQGAKIEIFDASGRRVRGADDTSVWDGRDDRGEIVESGIYLYQAEVEGQKISGVVTVAK